MAFKPGNKPKQLRVACPTAGTAVRLSNTDISASYFLIQACATNTGFVYVGSEAVVGTLCFAELDSGGSVSLGSPREWAGVPKFNLRDFWINTSVSGEEVNVGYLD